MDDDIKWTPTERLMQFLMGLCGFIGMLTPLALWVAWSELIYFVVIAVGAAALGSFFLFSWYFSSKVRSFAAQSND